MYLTYPLFRAADLGAWAGMMSHIGAGWSLDPSRLVWFFHRIDLSAGMFLATMALIPLAEIGEYLHRSPGAAAWTARRAPWVRGVRDLLLVFGTLVLGRWSESPFVYFQF
jgi:hypothetical protein